MGRGKNWDAEENCVLARAWIASSEDPIAGTDQTRKIFQDTIRRRFTEKGPAQHLVPDGKYGNRSGPSIKQHFTDMSAEVQKFFVSLGKVRACNPTGVGDEEVLSMAVAVHLEHTNRMDYDYKNFDKDQWLYYRAWKVLRHHPKWSCAPSATSAITVTQETQPEISQLASSGGQSTEDSETRETVAPTKPTERFGLGARGAKLARQEELRTQAVRVLAESAKRKSDVLEERNAIAAFSRPEAANLPETAKVLLCNSSHLSCAGP